MDAVDDRASRAAARRAQAANWPIRKFELGHEPLLDPLDSTTPDERVAAVAELSYRAFRLSNRPWPTYSRATMPGRLFSRSE